MNLKKKMLVVIPMIILVSLVTFLQTVGYASRSEKKVFGITAIRTRGNEGIGYAVGDPNNNGHPVWNIRSYSSKSASSPNSPQETLYCLKQGFGFTTINEKEEYDTWYDMLTERQAIAALGSGNDKSIYSNLVNGGNYNKILALLDLMYVPGKTNKAQFLSKAGVPDDEYTYEITDDDIEVAQQIALWYFTNPEKSEFNKTSGDDHASWLYYTKDGSGTGSYSTFSGYNDPGRNAGDQRHQQINMLYKYIVKTAEANANNYAEGQVKTAKPLTITGQSPLQYELSGDKTKFIVGPITVSKGSTTLNTLTMTVKNGGSDISTQVKVLDSQKRSSSVDAMKNGGTFYLEVPVENNNGSQLSVKFTQNYSAKTMKLWTSSTSDKEQPIVEIEEGPIDDETDFTVTPEKEEDKIADLALRKYITEVTGSEFNQGPRAPTIEDKDKIGENKNTADHTATYNHRKDPVQVGNGNTVTFTIKIYNEGTIDGRATQVIDQLPTGLQYVADSVTGDYSASYDSASNKITFTKKTPDNLAAYKGSGEPESSTITIKCNVVATAKTQNQVLTNLAWISGDEFAEEVEDVDSHPTDPSRKPNADELVNQNKDDYKGHTDNPSVSDNNDYWKGQEDDDDFEKVVIPGTEPEKIFDLALRKYITHVNGTPVDNPRAPEVDESELASGADHTATYNHRKDPVEVKVGDEITYNLTVYNEGAIAGRATKITDQLPTGIKFLEVVSSNYEEDSYDEGTNTLVLRKVGENNLPAYQGSGDPASETVTIKCQVTEEAANTGDKDKVFTNVAWISEDANEDGTVTDRDSTPSNKPTDKNKDDLVSDDENDYKGKDTNPDVTPGNPEDYWEGKEDDDDFEKVVIPAKDLPFDLALVKRIAEINGTPATNRDITADTRNLNTGKVGEKTTAEYDVGKEPKHVKKGDLIKYTFRIYNEGYIDGYASKITEDIPEGLEFVWSDKTGEELQNDTTFTDEEKEAIEFNQSMYWTWDDDMKTISTDYLSKDKEKTPGSNLIKAFGENPDGTKQFTEENYKELSVIFKVKADAPTGKVLVNEAAVTEHDDDGNPDTPRPDDRDSKPEEWPGREDHNKKQDEEDFDNVIIDEEEFDLALRKFIVGVVKDIDDIKDIEDLEQFKENDKYTRAPEVDTSKLNKLDENGKMVTTADYNHPKDPVKVTVGDYVIYMLRIYNEGSFDGYAPVIKDYLPNYLEFVDCEFNSNFNWEKAEEGNNTSNTENGYSTNYLENEKIEKAKQLEDGSYELDYVEVPVICKVKPDAKSDYNITNIADIAEYEDENHEPVEDRDSQPDNVDVPDEDDKPSYKDDETGDYIPGQQDDDDFEKVVVQIFDLSLRKWVSEVIVTEDGKTTVTPTGHQPYDDPEQTVKVDLNRKKLNSTVVKFKYGIRVTNEGDIAGYATEITDYIPEGLEMKEDENPLWEYVGNNVAVTTQLEDKLLQPGEFADIEILLTWINNEEDLGLKINTAEISDDYNEEGVPDVDSIPGNEKKGEDDIDDAPVILSITTGRAVLYLGLGITVLGMLGGGIFLIKKYVIK